MVRLGGLLVVLGFLSAILFQFTEYRLTLLSWADDYQPVLGIGIGVVGVLLLVAKKLTSKQKPAVAE
ncbi:hypothetical protein FKR81_09025 [Lentzea tibetensis]|uniref:Uncharacterized protein n=1 Tax=Lentzea tibetensis TaxID=2591470 RepID=A0A563EXN0_9PSEU|nr:hypothetical protein [Lentzea tibetensis]TWP52465.1 hypothetical protein FKR81_09025 [Lentzea tibetensis]